MNAGWLLQTFHVAGSPGAIFTQIATGLTLIALVVLAATELPRLVSWAREERKAALSVASLMLAGVVIRFAAPASQMDIHYRMSPAEGHVDLAQSPYGLAFTSVVRSIWWITGPADASVHAFNLVVGTLSIGLVYALCRALHTHVYAAVAAAALLAFNPTHVLFSHTDIQTILEVALTLWGIVALISATGPQHRLIAGLALGLAAVLRPEAIVVPLIAASAWALSQRKPGRWDGLLVVGLLLLLPSLGAWAGLALSGDSKTSAFVFNRFARHGLSHFLFMLPAWTHWLTPVGLVLALFAAPSRKTVVWAALCALALSVLVPGFSVADLAHAGARHQIRAVPFAAIWAGIGLGWFVEWLEHRVSSAPAAACGLGVLATLPVIPYGIAPTSLSEEYGFVRDHIRQVPRTCQIVGYYGLAEKDKGLKPPMQLSRQAGLEHQWVDLGFDDLPAGCRVYYRGNHCFSAAPRQPLALRQPDGRLLVGDPCRQFEAMYELTPIATEEIVGRGHGTDYYPDDSVMEIGFFEIGTHR